MPRSDLIALTDDGLIQLANAGLVKRGLKELAAGVAPRIDEDVDGTVAAVFQDGTQTRLSPGRPLTDATCTCPASGMCRHRVALALGYRAAHAGAAEPADATWDPATIDSDAFEASLSSSARNELARLLAARIDARLDRGRVPAVRLPMATVRFLAPNDLDYARCDCSAGLRCAHVALALRAFRASDGAVEVSLGPADAPSDAGGDDALRGVVDAVLSHLLDVGAVAGVAAHAQPLARAREASRAAGAVQLTLTLDALAEQIEAYETRSARYDELAVLALATELYARPRAGDRIAALGLGEPFETAMSKTRLISLGARLRAEGDDIRAAILLADSDTGATMLMEKLFSPAPTEKDGFADTVPRRLMAPGLPILGAGRGQILTSVGRRRADGLLALGAGSGGRTALSPRDATFDFSAPLKARDVHSLVERFSLRPPGFLRPRRRIDDVHVFDVDEVLGQSWTPGSQLWQAAVSLPNGGGALYLERAYDAAAPGALDILSACFDGAHGRVRQVSGSVRVEAGTLVLDPWSLGADRFIAPDIDQAKTGAAPNLASGGTPNTPLENAVRALAGAVHAGRRASGALSTNSGARLADTLSARGFSSTGRLFGDWFTGEPADVVAFGRIAVWLATLGEETA